MPQPWNSKLNPGRGWLWDGHRLYMSVFFCETTDQDEGHRIEVLLCKCCNHWAFVLVQPFLILFNCSMMSLCVLRQWLWGSVPWICSGGKALFENPICHRMDTELLSPYTLPAAFGTSDSRILVATICLYNKFYIYMYIISIEIFASWTCRWLVRAFDCKSVFTCLGLD